MLNARDQVVFAPRVAFSVVNHSPAMKARRFISTLSLVLLLLSSGRALAHDPGLSTAVLRYGPDRLEVTLTFPVSGIQQVVNVSSEGKQKFLRDEWPKNSSKWTELAPQAIEVKFDGQLARAGNVRCRYEESDGVSLVLSFPHGPCSELFVQSKWLELLPPGHRQFLSLQDANGTVLLEWLLSADADSVSVSLMERNGRTDSKKNSFTGFLMLGVEHIWTGYDHLLFLFSLLIVARSFMSSLKVITCFTVAHSITLALATLGHMEIPSRIVEPLIAASIVYVGIENLARGGDVKGRGWLTFGFGLVHGLGFASVLRDMGVGAGSGGVAVPLFSFNLGVELGQIVVAAILLPILWKLRSRPAFAERWVPVCSAVVALLGGYWLVQRLWMN
jgi:hydrogenase/urease accessory protein HupE